MDKDLTKIRQPRKTRNVNYQLGVILFFALLHAGIFLIWWTPPTLALLGWCAATYALRMFGVTAGYHRYFGHRSYKLGRVAQFAMAFLAQSSAQKGVLWWAAHHRYHHRHSDDERDIHSPVRTGFWWSHVGWILSNQFDNYDKRLISDFETYPELRWLNKYHWLPSLL